ncbi:MBG domain-containing protein [Ruminococcus sp.]|uniref:MBG domain-containing protein n=1 Tax=Ruminococcus sp. TaxID=41978 RepID=UPI0025D2B714|nr:MBG domain-containing protein [Ruminococcus sp.]MBQ8965980.1 hypothetical protein [Ruminococcus sp.]
MKKVLAGVLAVMLVFSGTVLPGNTRISSSSTINAAAESWGSKMVLTSDLTVSGGLDTSSDVDLNGHTLTVNGDMYMKAGALRIGSGKLIVKGNLYMGKDEQSSYAYIVMNNSSGSITVEGDMVWKLYSSIDTGNDKTKYASDTAGLITAGTINIKGNFSDLTPSGAYNFNSFQMMGTSKLVMCGSGAQTLRCADNTVLNYLEHTGSGKLTLANALWVTQPLTQDLDVTTTSAVKVVQLDLGGHTMNVTGSLTQADVEGIKLSGGTLNISKNFIINSGYTDLGGGKLNVGGNLTIGVASGTTYKNANAGIKMTNANDVLTVGGDMAIYGTTSTGFPTQFQNGKLYVAGDFNYASGKVTFSSPHTTILNGTDVQEVSLASGKFYNLQLTQPISQYKPSNIASMCVNLISDSVDISGATVTLSASSYTYDGTAKKPTVTVKVGTKTLTSGTDYTVSYQNNTNAGTASVVITGNGSTYVGTKTQNFTINPKSVSGLTLATTSYTYDGTAKEPAVKDGSLTLVKGTDYTVTFTNNVNAGTASAKIVGKGNYTGTVTKSFTIKPGAATSISGATVTLSQTLATYTGSAIKPTATVKLGSTTLTSGTDYTVSYSNNTNAGTATVTITGKGSYTGTVTKNFTISAKSVSGLTLGTTSYTYDGTAKTPAVKDGSKTLTSGTDYTVTYSNNTNAGTATAKITGKGNYTGTVEKTFTISPAAISGATITLSGTSFTYTGSAIKPTVTVKSGSKTLTSGTDYTVSYSNNTNVGTGTVTITGKGNYTGTVNKTFTIAAAAAASISGATVTLSATSYTYDGTAKQPTATVKLDGKALTSGTDYTVGYSNNTNAGTATVTITGKGSYTGTVTKTFTISPAAISGATITLSGTSFTYTGSAIKPTVTVKSGSKTLTSGTDYTVSYSNNTNVGTGTVTIAGKGNYTGTVNKTFTIVSTSSETKPIADATVSLSPAAATYDGTAKEPVPTVKLDGTTLTKGTDYTVSYNNNVNAGTATVTITGKGSYSGTATKNFTIAAKNISGVTLATTSYTYDGKAKEPAVKDGSVTLVKGTDYTVVFTNNVNAGNASAKITGTGNYTGTVTKYFTIEPAAATSISGAAVTLSGTSFTYTGSAITPTVTVKLDGNTLTSGTDYTVAYKNNTNVGTATVTITGKGSYTGTVEKNFTITAAAAENISGATVTLSATSYTYDGTAKKPTAVVKLGSKTLTSGTDYTAAYSNNTNAGTATVTITGKGSYTGTVSKTFTISPKSVSGVSLAVTSYTYDGKAKEPAVKDGSTTLVKGTDYTVVFTNNVNAGTASAAITGKGNYTGTVTKTFTIKAAAVETKSLSDAVITLSPASFTYSGSENKPALTVKVGSATLVQGTDFTAEYSNNIKAGTARVTITGKGSYTGTAYKDFTINKLSLSDAKITAADTVYNGTAKKPTVSVRLGTKLLVENTDFTVTYSNNVNAGTGSVTITGIGNYTGTASSTFTISPYGLNAAAVTVANSDLVYDGTEKKPSVTVTLSGKTLIAGTDYTVGYTNNINAGAATVTVTGIGNYNKTATGRFTITAKDISALTVKADTDNYIYDGKAKQPTVTVMDGSRKLTLNTDYTVTYQNNTAVGTAKAVVKGKGNYSGTADAEFTISRAAAVNISGCTVTLSATSYTYDGTAKTPAVVVKNGSNTLTRYTDYTVSYGSNVDAGTATVTITGDGTNYAGSKTVNFTIAPKNISGVTFSVNPTEFEYDGTAKTPAPTVKDGTKELMPDTDYTVSYSNNKAAGQAKATITGKGNYTGTKSVEFTITEKAVEAVDISGCTVEAIKDVAYSGGEQTPALTIKNGSAVLKEGTDYTLTYSDNVNAGQATVTIAGTGAYTGVKTANFRITAKSMNGVTVTLAPVSYVYDGSEKQPAATVKDGDAMLILNSDYTIAYLNNVEAGEATAVITGLGNYAGTKTAAFTISEAQTVEPDVIDISSCEVTLSQDSFVYDGSAKKPEITVTCDGKTLTEGTDYLVDMGANIEVGTVAVTIKGTGRFKGSTERSFAITKRGFEGLDISIVPETVEYTGEAVTPAVSIAEGSKGLTRGVDYDVSYANNVDAGTAAVTITGMGNYSGEVKKEFTITPSDISKASMKLESYSFVADGSEHKPAVTIIKDGRTLEAGVDFDAWYPDGKEVGTYYVAVNGKGNYSGSLGQQYIVSAADAKSIEGFDVSLEPESAVYNGEAQRPVVTMKNGDTVLYEWTDFEVVYTDNINAGKGTVNIIGKGSYKDSIAYEFDIAAADMSGVTVTAAADTYEYDGTEKTPVVTAEINGTALLEGRDYTVEYADNVNAGTGKAIVKGAGNYAGTAEVSFTITGRSADHLKIELESSEVEFTGEAVTPAVTVYDGDKQLTEGVDYELVYTDNDKAGTGKVTVKGTGNYSGEAESSFSIVGGEEDDFLLGDLNRDGDINVTDITLMAAHVKSIRALNEYGLKAADVNGDGDINVTDLVKLAAHVKGIKPLDQA